MGRKPGGWFKCYSDILEDPRLMNQKREWVLGAWIRLLSMANRSESKDGVLWLPYSAFCVAMGRSRIDYAMLRLRYLVASKLIAAALHEHSVLILIPNYLERQETEVRRSTHEDKDEDKDITPPISPPKSGKPDSHESKAKAVWPELRRAAAAYGVGWGKTPGSAQVKIIAERIKADGLNEDQLEAIIHGYITLRGTSPDNGFDPLKHLYPKTLYRPSNWPDYLAAAENAPKRKEPKRTIFEGFDRAGHKLPTQEEIAAALAEGHKTFEH